MQLLKFLAWSVNNQDTLVYLTMVEQDQVVPKIKQTIDPAKTLIMFSLYLSQYHFDVFCIYVNIAVPPVPEGKRDNYMCSSV